MEYYKAEKIHYKTNLRQLFSPEHKLEAASSRLLSWSEIFSGVETNLLIHSAVTASADRAYAIALSFFTLSSQESIHEFERRSLLVASVSVFVSSRLKRIMS